jgi:hypothetical protein
MVGISFLLALMLDMTSRAQSDEYRFEVGVQFAALKQGPGYWFDDASGIGGGGRLTINLTKHLALEGELNYFPSTGYYEVQRLQGQFGVKSGIRFNQFGLFGKLRPGFLRTQYEFPVICIQAPCPPISVDQTGFALDVGGVVEFYPARRVTVRFDIGDTVAHRRPEIFPLALPLQSDLRLLIPPKQTSHNLQINAGLGFRF